MKGNCARCSTYRWALDKDHIIPKGRGGTDDPSNIQYLCQNCHFDKTHLEDFKKGSYTAEMRQKMSRAKSSLPSSYFKHMRAMRKTPISVENAIKMGHANRGRKQSHEHLSKLIAARRGKHWSQEIIEKRAAGNRGKKRSAETIARMTAAQRLRVKPDAF